MKRNPSATEVIDALSESINESVNKQRRFRSATFWNKFGFERRTKERVDAVKVLLNERAIEVSLDDSLFGSEKRSETIVFKRANSSALLKTEPAKWDGQNMPHLPKIDGEPAFENVHRYDRIEAKLKHLAEVNQLNFSTIYIFSCLFVEVFWNDMPSYELSPGVLGATRSNWTYHTASAFSQTCKIMNLTCKFEAVGKRDAVIETNEQNSEIILVAEWEWDYDDIFGTGKELDKLRKTCKKNPSADAFLLIYCPVSKYLKHLEEIANYWIDETKNDEQPPNLFVHTVIFEAKGINREFQRLKTVMIHPKGIEVWSDRFL
jgi:hypothetical protein